MTLHYETIEFYKHTHERKNMSAWRRGVYTYVYEIYDTLSGYESLELNTDNIFKFEKSLEPYALNGAKDWYEYSWGGCSLIYNEDIAKTLCTPSEFKRRKRGELRPNSQEEWLDVQARALRQAYRIVTMTLWSDSVEGKL